MQHFTKPSAIKVGVIGYGPSFNMGRVHLNDMQHAGMAPTAVADIDPQRLEAARQDFPGIATYGSAAEMLRKSDVNLLAIITPHNSHARLAIQCLNAGRHVVTEKPFAVTKAECDAMIAAARRNRVMLSTFHNRHWDGWIVRAVKTIRTGVIGDVVRVECRMGGWAKPGDWWRSSKRIAGSILHDWGVHLLEYTLQIVDAEIAEVSGYAHSGFWAPQTPWKEDTTEDEAALVVRYAGGAWSSLCMSAIESRTRPFWIEVTGTKGAYAFEHNSWELITHDGAHTVTTRGANPPTEWWRFYQNIAAHLTKGAKLVITPEWARRPIHIIDLALQSARQGRALKAKYK
jgi:scyllo-inositol 2-dehydrogenase (NADP+)